MKYPYIVIKNGKWYAAGEEVPDTVPGNKPTGYTKTETVCRQRNCRV